MAILDDDLAGFDNVISLPRAAAGSVAKPEPAGQAVQLAQSTGFPASVIGADLESYQQIDKGQKAAAAIERNQWISGYVARNAEAAEVSNDDYDKLDVVSKKVERFTIAGRSGGLLQAIPDFFINSIPETYELLSTTQGRAKLQKNAPHVFEHLISPFLLPGDAQRQGFDLRDPADMERAQGLGLMVGLGKRSPQVEGVLPGRSSPQEINAFLSRLEGMKTRKEIDDFLSARAAGDKDPKVVLQIEHAKADSAALDSAIVAAADTATKGRAPTLLEDFVKGHETGTLSIPAQAIADVYRAEGKMPGASDGLFGFVPDLPARLVAGAETGMEIDVPVSTYIARVDPTVHEKIKESIRFSNDGMTLAEAKEAKPESTSVTFETAKGSKYTVHEDKTTTRDKAYRPEHGEAEQGIQPRSEKTVYVEASDIGRFAPPAEGSWRVADMGNGTFSFIVKNADGQWGVSPESKNVPVFNDPAVGRIPLELWQKERLDQYGVDAYRKMHPGNEIVKIQGEQVAKPTDPVEAAALSEKTELGLKPLFAEPLPGMDKVTFERYNKKVLAAQQKALDKATEVQTREAAKRLGEEWKANEAALRPEVEGQVRAFPDIAADRFLRTGELPDGSKMAKVRLDEGYVNALLAKTDIPEIMLGKDGIHPDDISPLFGFNSGAEMVRALNDLAAERKASKMSPTQQFNDLVKRELASQMEAKYGNLEQAIAQEARTLALDDLHFDIIADELRILADATGSKPPYTKDGLKALATETFSKLDSKQAANFEKFQKTAGRNGLLAEKMNLKGDFIEAFNAKQIQAFQFLLAKQSEQFGKLVDRTAKKIDLVTKNDEIASMEQEHFDQLKRVLGQLGFDLRGSDPNPATSLGDFVAQSDGQLAVAAWLTDGTLLPRDPGALTVQQMQDLSKTIDSMMHVGRQAKKLDSARGAAEIQNVVVDVKAELARFDFIANPLNPSIGQRTKSLARWVSAWSLLVERMLDYTDKFDPNGPLTTFLDRPLRDGNVKEIQLNEKVSRKLRDLSKLTDDSINDSIPNNVIPSSRSESGFLDMNRRNLRMLMGYMGSESGIQKVINGYLPPGQKELIGERNGKPVHRETAQSTIQRAQFANDVWKLINENATKQDWQWVKGMHEIFESLWPEAATMIERDTGVAPDPIKPLTMRSEKYGDFPGGYWPIKYDRLDSNIEGHIAGKHSLFDKNYITAATPHGYTMTRKEWYGALDLSGQLLASHIRGMIHDIAFREPVRNAAKLINNQEFMTAMTQRWGKEYAGLLPGWLKDIANSSRVDDSYSQGIARISALIRQNMATTLTGWNPSTIIKHGGTALGMSAAAVGEKSFLSAAVDFGVKGMLGAARDLMRGQKQNDLTPEFVDALKAVNDPTEYGDGVRQFILDSSAVMRNRQRQSMDNIRDQMNENLFAGTSLTGISQGFMDFRGSAMDWVKVPVAMSDAVSAFPTWLAAYKETMAKTGDHQQAVFEADKQVSRAHGSNFIGDKPMILRTSEPMRWFTPLYNFYNHFLNMLMNFYWDAKAWGKGKDEPGANKASLSKRMFWLGLMPIIFEELALPPLTKDERGGVGMHMARTLAAHFGATIPILRDFTNAWRAGVDPGTGFLGTASRALSNIAKDMAKAASAGKRASENWMINAATAIGFATGMVPSQAGRTGSYVKDRITGKERTPRSWEELRQGLRTGHSKPRIMR